MRKPVSIAISLIVTVLLVWLLLRQVSLADIVGAVGAIPLAVLAGGFVLYALTQALRGARFWFLLQRTVPLKKLVSMACVHNALANILPARTGELSYIIMLRKHSNHTVGAGVGTLALARVFDLLAIAVLFLVAALVIPDLPASLADARLPIVILLAVIVVVLVGAVLFSTTATRMFEGLLRVVRLDHTNAGRWLMNNAEETLHSLHVIKSVAPVIGALSCSLLIWVAQFTINYFVFRGVGLTVSYAAVALAGSITVLLNIIPVQGIVGFGTTEAYWVVGLAGLGIGTSAAIQAGFAQHLVTILYFVILGVLGTMALSKKE